MSERCGEPHAPVAMVLHGRSYQHRGVSELCRVSWCACRSFVPDEKDERW